MVGDATTTGSINTQLFGYSTSAPGTSANITLTHGPKVGSHSFIRAIDPATDVVGEVLTPVVSVDSRVFQVLVVAVDDFNQRPTLVSTIVAGFSVANGAVSGSCITDSLNSSCIVTIVLTSGQFPSNSSIVSNITYNVNGGPIKTSDRKVTLLPLPGSVRAPGGLPSILVNMPQRTLRAGEAFTVTVSASLPSPLYTKTFNIRVSSSPNLLITSITSNASNWIATSAIPNSTVGAIASLYAGDSGPPSSITLFQVQLRVASASVTSGSFSLFVLSLTDNNDNEVEGSVQYFGNKGWSFNGSIALSANNPVAIVPSKSGILIFNTAVLNGIAVSIPLTFTAFTATGAPSLVSSGLSCTSRNSSVASVAADCSSVFVSGSETTGGLASIRVTLTTSSGPVTTEVMVFVLLPEQNLEIRVTDNTLNLVTGWLSIDDGCAQAYQQAEVRVYATFVFGTDALVLQVTSLVAAQLISLSSAVAQIIPTFSVPLVKGISAGTATIGVLSPRGILWGELNIDVSDLSVTVTQINSVPIESITMTVSSPINYLSDAQATATISSSLAYDFQTAYIYAVAIFSDGTQFSLENGQNVSVVPNNNRFVSANGLVLTPIASGTARGSVLWQSACSPVPISRGSFSVSVSLQEASNLVVSASAVSITRDGDVASVVGIPTDVSLSVLLQYASGRTIDVASDPRVTFRSSAPFVQISSVASSIVARVTSAGFGPVVLSVSLGNITSNISIVVVRGVSLQLTPRPFPLFDGSSSIVLDTLGPYAANANETVHQRAVLQVLASLSNNAVVDISTQAGVLNGLSFAFGTALNAASFVTLSSSSTGVVLTRARSASQVVGALGVTLTLFSLTSPRLTLTLTNQPVFVTALYSPVFVDTLVSTASFQVSVRFNDSTVIPNFYVNGQSYVPGLITLSSDAAYVRVNSLSGQVTAVANSPQTLTLTAFASAERGIASTSPPLFATNLVPAVGDVDLGRQGSGLAVPPVPSVGSDFTLPLHANLGNYLAGVVQIDVSYDPQVLEILRVTPGADWESTQFSATLNDPVGEFVLGGLSSGIGGSNAHLADLTFRAIGGANSITTVSALIVVLNDPTLSNIGIFAGVPSVPGTVNFVIGPSVSRRGVPMLPEAGPLPVFSRVRPVRAVNSTCNNIRIGDANADCSFNLLDAAFLNNAIVQRTFNSSYITRSFPSSQVQAMDLDRNGAVELLDSQYAYLTVFRKALLMLAPPSLESTLNQEGSACAVTVSIPLARDDYSVPLVNSTNALFALQSNDDAILSQLPTSALSGMHIASMSNGRLYASTTNTTKHNGVFYSTFAHGGFSLNAPLGVSVVIMTFDQATSNAAFDPDRVTNLLQTSSSSPSVTNSSIPPTLLKGIDLTFKVEDPGNASSVYVVKITRNDFYPLQTFDQSYISQCKPAIIISPQDSTASSNKALLGLLALLVLLVLIVLLIIFLVRRRRTKKNGFHVRVSNKKGDNQRADHHPYENEGFAKGYDLRTSEDPQFILGREIWVVRGIKYVFTFDKSVTSDFPLYISLSEYGGGNGIEPYLEGVESNASKKVKGSPGCYGQELYFTPSGSTPNLLYYQCEKQKSMGYKIYVVDSQAEVGRPVFVPLAEPTYEAADGGADVETDAAPTDVLLPVYRPPPLYQRAASFSHHTPSPSSSDKTPNVRFVEPEPQTPGGRRAPPYIPPPSYVNSLKFASGGHAAADANAGSPSYRAPPNYYSVLSSQHNGAISPSDIRASVDPENIYDVATVSSPTPLSPTQVSIQRQHKPDDDEEF